MMCTLYGADTFSAACARDDITVKQRYNAQKKSVVIGCILLALCGYLGMHRFYGGQIASGGVMLFITALCAITLGSSASVVGLMIVGLWCLIDIYLMPRAIAAYNRRLMISLGY